MGCAVCAENTVDNTIDNTIDNIDNPLVYDPLTDDEERNLVIALGSAVLAVVLSIIIHFAFGFGGGAANPYVGGAIIDPLYIEDPFLYHILIGDL
jgi:hypothetical protein